MESCAQLVGNAGSIQSQGQCTIAQLQPQLRFAGAHVIGEIEYTPIARQPRLQGNRCLLEWFEVRTTEADLKGDAAGTDDRFLEVEGEQIGNLTDCFSPTADNVVQTAVALLGSE